jgi:hypothetical protein
MSRNPMILFINSFGELYNWTGLLKFLSTGPYPHGPLASCSFKMPMVTVPQEVNRV